MATPVKKSIFSRATDYVAVRLGYVNKSDRKAIELSPTAGNGIFAGAPMIDMTKGLRKPGNVQFDMLRRIAKADSITRICINVIKKEVSQSDYEFVDKAGQPVSDKSKLSQLEELFDNVNSNGENIRVFWDKVLEDLLVLDAGVFEKVFNAKGELVEMCVIDGATIRPVYNAYGEMEPNRAYVQVIDGKVTAEFKINEIVYMMQSPQNDIRHFGYGMSPIESVLLSVQASLQADLYNSQTFTKDNIPPGVMDLGDMSGSEARAFIAEWEASVIQNTQKLKFVWGAGKNGSPIKNRYFPLQQNNKDMQYMEYTQWLSKIKLSVYGLTSMDANLTQDINRSTSNTQHKISQSRGVMAVKRLLEEYINREIIQPMGIEDVDFRFSRITNLDEKKTQADIDKIYLDAGVVAPSFIADREGFDEILGFMGDDLDIDDGGENTNLTPSNKPAANTPGAKAADVLEQTPTTKAKKAYYRPIYK